MSRREMLQNVLQKLMDKGADKVSLHYSDSVKEEFNILYKELNLLRTVESAGLSLVVIKDQKKASTRINQFDAASIDAAVAEVMVAVENSNPDPAFDISPNDEGVWSCGDLQPDADLVTMRLMEFSATMRNDYPIVEYDAYMAHVKVYEAYLNSNGAFFEQNSGYYNFFAMFTAKKDGKMSSFNVVSYALPALDKPLMEINETREYIRQSTEQTTTKPIPENFTGDVIMAPLWTSTLLEDILERHLGDSGLLMNSSKFPDHLEQKILDEKLTVINDFDADGICLKEYYCDDGFRSVKGPLIEKGVLKQYPISLYAANKSGKERTIGPVSNLVIEAGSTSLADMIKSVKQGILCMRFSTGAPNANGDFSGVVKNSYYIEDGKVAYPISETMMNGNTIEMLSNIAEISSEVYYNGAFIMPYMKFRNIFISRK
jgi:PmbA protein